MDLFSQEIVNHLRVVFQGEVSLDDRLCQLSKIGVYIERLKVKEKKKLFEHIHKNRRVIAAQHQLLCQSYLFYLSKEDKVLREIAKDLFLHTDSLAEYHYLIWKIRISMFQFSGMLKSETLYWVKERCMRPSYLKAIEAILTCIQDTETYKPRKVVKKVALAVGQLLSELHAPTRTALMIALGLMSEYGIEVHIINTNLIPVTRPLEYFGCSFANFNESLLGKQLIKYTEPEFGTHEVTVYSQLPGPFTLTSMVNIWNYVESEKFDALINLGDILFAFDYFITKIPVLGIPTLKELPISKSDQYLLAHDALSSEEQAIVEKHCSRPAYLGVSFDINKEKGGETFLRSDYNIADDAFVFVVVGNRLLQEIDKTFLGICQSILNASDKNNIIFVGNSKYLPQLLEQNEISGTERVQSFDFQKDLRSFYTMCDVYLNPFRAGGGVSAQMAIAEHIPVITLAKGDVASALPKALRCETVLVYQKLVLDLANNKSLYAQWQASMKELAFSREGNKKNIEIIYNLLNDLNHDAMVRFEDSQIPVS